VSLQTKRHGAIIVLGYHVSPLMHGIFANSIWAPTFVYFYDLSSAMPCVAIGFIAEFGVFRLYTHRLVPAGATLRGLVVANLVSFVVGFVLMGLMPFGVDKNSLVETATTFSVLI
jgi:hypothetical protein